MEAEHRRYFSFLAEVDKTLKKIAGKDGRRYKGEGSQTDR